VWDYFLNLMFDDDDDDDDDDDLVGMMSAWLWINSLVDWNISTASCTRLTLLVIYFMHI